IAPVDCFFTGDDARALHSFPTRRSSDLGNRLVDYSELMEVKSFPLFRERGNKGGFISEQKNRRNNPYGRLAYRTIGFINSNGVRSEERTSELQSRENLVCRLLLEKKNNK